MKQNMCIFPGCKEVHKWSQGFDTTEKIELAIGVNARKAITPLYKLTTKPCASCAVTPNKTYFTRHSPDAAMVMRYGVKMNST